MQGRMEAASRSILPILQILKILSKKSTPAVILLILPILSKKH